MLAPRPINPRTKSHNCVTTIRGAQRSQMEQPVECAIIGLKALGAPYMAVRDRYVATPPPVSTLMIVSGFTRHEFKVEVEVIAAKL
jgi:enamine deaminase RidA (YjgF/YER057c/UK114 family)